MAGKYYTTNGIIEKVHTGLWVWTTYKFGPRGGSHGTAVTYEAAKKAMKAFVSEKTITPKP